MLEQPRHTIGRMSELDPKLATSGLLSRFWCEFGFGGCIGSASRSHVFQQANSETTQKDPNRKTKQNDAMTCPAAAALDLIMPP